MEDSDNRTEPFEKSNSLRLLEQDQKNLLSTACSNQYSSIIHFYYVSDLHIDYKLFTRSDSCGKEEIAQCVKESVDRIIPPISPENLYNNRPIEYDGLVLLCGDVAIRADVLQAFLSAFSRRVQEYNGRLVFIMGNHERSYIDQNNPVKNVEISIVEKDCREFCQSHDIIFLHNELLLTSGRYNMILDTQSILNSSDIQLAEACSHFDAIIFGGTGFEKRDPYCGLTKDVQITDKIIADYSQDIDNFKNVYQRLLDVFKNDDRIIVMTHFPPSAWIDGPICSNWVYFHGHTHQDNFVFSETMKIFGDNQWGHEGVRDGLKHYCKGLGLIFLPIVRTAFMR